MGIKLCGVFFSQHYSVQMVEDDSTSNQWGTEKKKSSVRIKLSSEHYVLKVNILKASNGVSVNTFLKLDLKLCVYINTYICVTKTVMVTQFFILVLSSTHILLNYPSIHTRMLSHVQLFVIP